MRPGFPAAALAAALALTAFTAAAQVAAPSPKAGDTWTYRELNGFNKLPVATWTREVTAADGDLRVITRSADGKVSMPSAYTRPGVLASGQLNDRARGALTPALELLPFPLQAGQQWTQKVVRQDVLSGENREVLITGKVVGWESVRVPAGEFKALRIERRLWLGDYDQFRGQTWRGETEWYAPEVGGTVKLEVFEEYPNRRNMVMGSYMPGDRPIYELLSFGPAH